ncbi:MAG: threonine synthase [Bacillota bacterium]
MFMEVRPGENGTLPYLLQCIRCGAVQLPEPSILVCPACGDAGLLDVIYDYDHARRLVSRESIAASGDLSHWRYAQFMPVSQKPARAGLRVGWTPLYRLRRLGEVLGLESLYLKDEGLNPTGSLKDRASSLAVVLAEETGFSAVSCASTGNAASSLAGNAAVAGLGAFIFVPARAPEGKVAQLLVYGAQVFVVEGTYQEAYLLSDAAIKAYGWYNRNAAINPYLVEGKKTVSFEIAEQLAWEAPDWVVVSVGDGCTLAGIWKGFWDLFQTGLISGLPRLAGVQASGCAPLARAYLSGTRWQPEPEHTFADSIAVGTPRNPDKALRAVTQSGGVMTMVDDDAIDGAMTRLGRTSGVFAEPAAAAAVAGLERLVQEGTVLPSETVVVVSTGNGLKDVAGARRATGAARRVPPCFADFQAWFENSSQDRGMKP